MTRANFILSAMAAFIGNLFHGDNRMRVEQLIRELEKFPSGAEVKVGVRVLGARTEIMGEGAVKTIFYDPLKLTVFIKGESLIT